MAKKVNMGRNQPGCPKLDLFGAELHVESSDVEANGACKRRCRTGRFFRPLRYDLLECGDCISFSS